VSTGSFAVATLDQQRGRIRLAFPYHSETVARAKRIPGAVFQRGTRDWLIPATPSAAQAVLEAFKGGLPVKADSKFRELVAQYQVIRESAALKQATDLPRPPLWKGPPQWNHQLQAYHFAYNMPATMLALDMGVGKSRIVVDLVVNRNHRKVLLVAPLSVIQEWPNQFRQYAGKPVIVAPMDDRIGSVADKVKQTKLALMQGDLEDHPVVIVTNYESVWRPPFGPIYDEAGTRIKDQGYAMQAGFDLVVCDESHRIQAYNSKISKFLAKLGEKVPHRLALSGTPFSSGPLSVFGQYRFLDPAIFGTNIKSFREKYAVMGGYQNHEVRGFQNLEELQEKFYSIAMRVESRDVLDLPDEMHIRRTFKLSDKGKRAYKDLENLFVAEFREGKVTATNALTKLLRLQQMTSGFARLDATEAEEGETIRVDHEKQKLLEEILADINPNESVVVFARFIHDLDAIAAACKKLGRRYMELSGRIKQTEEWRTGPPAVLGAQMAAGNAGVNLVRAHYCVYFSVGFSLAQFSQSLARTMRPGQHHAVSYFHLVAEDTVDVKVYDALNSKQEIVSAILGGLK
jgi:SNF2 family DNA or RNA helicase